MGNLSYHCFVRMMMLSWVVLMNSRNRSLLNHLLTNESFNFCSFSCVELRKITKKQFYRISFFVEKEQKKNGKNFGSLSLEVEGFLVLVFYYFLIINIKSFAKKSANAIIIPLRQPPLVCFFVVVVVFHSLLLHVIILL